MERRSRRLPFGSLAAAGALAALVGAGLPSAHASQLYVCSGCTSSPTPNDPVFINPTSVTLGLNGAHSANSPLLVIVGEANTGSGTTAPTISLPSGINAAAAGTYYGAAVNGTTTGELDGTLGNGQDAYTQVGLSIGSGGGASESFANWSGLATYPHGSPNPDHGVTSFDLYVFGINYALSDTNLITIDFTNLAADSYVIGYAEGSQQDETPFTVAGFSRTGTHSSSSSVPEPASLVLFGTALIGAGLTKLRLRRRR